MRILFISPSIVVHNNHISLQNLFLGKIVFTGSLNFKMLSAVTPDKHTITIVDDEHQKVDFNKECDLVGISATTPAAIRAYDLANKFRKRGKTVVLGGWHPSALPEEAKQHADSVVVGEAETIWPQLLMDMERGRLKPYYIQQNPIDLEKLPPPDQKSMHKREGFIVGKIQATRGCRMGCEYCSITNSICGKQVRIRPVKQVIEEIRSIPQKILYFCDPSMTLHPEYSKQLFREMIGLKKKFYCNGNSSILNHDEELLQLASEAGCIEWAIGFESVSQESLNSIRKKTNKVLEFASTVKKIHDHNMNVMGNFMFGLEADHPDIFKKTLDFIFKWELDLASFNIFTPFPGTPLFERLEREGRILTKDWSKYDICHVVFKPKHMTPDELLHGTKGAYEEFFSMHNTAHRSLRCLKSGVYTFLTTGLENLFRARIV